MDCFQLILYKETYDSEHVSQRNDIPFIVGLDHIFSFTDNVANPILWHKFPASSKNPSFLVSSTVQKKCWTTDKKDVLNKSNGRHY